MDFEDLDRMIESVIRCFEELQARTKQIAKREIRRKAAINLLFWFGRNPIKTATVEALSAEHPNPERHYSKDPRNISNKHPLNYNARTA